MAFIINVGKLWALSPLSLASCPLFPACWHVPSYCDCHAFCLLSCYCLLAKKSHLGKRWRTGVNLRTYFFLLRTLNRLKIPAKLKPHGTFPSKWLKCLFPSFSQRHRLFHWSETIDFRKLVRMEDKFSYLWNQLLKTRLLHSQWCEHHKKWLPIF